MSPYFARARSRVGQLAPDLEEGRELDGRGFAHRAPEEREFEVGVESGALVHDVGDELPTAGAWESRFARLRIELIEQLGAHGHEEQDLLGDAVAGAPGAPVLGRGLQFEVHEAVGERGGHAVNDAAIAFAVAARDDRGAGRELVFAALALQGQLVERGLHHRHAGGELLQVDEVERGAGGGRQEGRGRPAGAVVAVAPGDAAQIDGVEHERADVDVVVAVLARHPLCDLALAASGRAPDDHGLLAAREQAERFGELARAQCVVGGDGVGVGHRRAP